VVKKRQDHRQYSKSTLAQTCEQLWKERQHVKATEAKRWRVRLAITAFLALLAGGALGYVVRMLS
jgi:hypothetical protein